MSIKTLDEASNILNLQSIRIKRICDDIKDINKKLRESPNFNFIIHVVVNQDNNYYVYKKDIKLNSEGVIFGFESLERLQLYIVGILEGVNLCII